MQVPVFNFFYLVDSLTVIDAAARLSLFFAQNLATTVEFFVFFFCRSVLLDCALPLGLKPPQTPPPPRKTESTKSDNQDIFQTFRTQELIRLPLAFMGLRGPG